MTQMITKANTFSTIKFMNSSTPTNLAMRGGDIVYGTLSATKTDIINFTHFYRAGNPPQKVELELPCKVTTLNAFSITETPEPVTPPPPPPVDGDDVITSITAHFSDGHDEEFVPKV